MSAHFQHTSPAPVSWVTPRVLVAVPEVDMLWAPPPRNEPAGCTRNECGN